MMQCKKYWRIGKRDLTYTPIFTYCKEWDQLHFLWFEIEYKAVIAIFSEQYGWHFVLIKQNTLFELQHKLLLDFILFKNLIVWNCDIRSFL